MPEGEWDAFLTSLRTPLPTSFRINGSGQFAAGLRDHLENDFFSKFGSGPLVVRGRRKWPQLLRGNERLLLLVHLQVDGEELAPPRALEWYPDRLAWSVPPVQLC